MSNVFNRKTGEVLYKVHTPAYNVDDWSINPVGIKEAANIPQRYRKLKDNTISEVDLAEKDLIDTEYISYLKDQLISTYCKLLSSELIDALTNHKSSLDYEQLYLDFLQNVERVKAIVHIDGLKDHQPVET